jgi:ATP adenylyltransferase
MPREHDPACLFRAMAKDRFADAHGLAFVMRDAAPATALHTLILPRRHVARRFDPHAAGRRASDALLERARREIVQRDPSVAVFNIGINSGEAAGQTICRRHVHLVSRRAGDMANPRDGVWAAIPGKQSC